jgi:UPF0176 protein
MSKDRIVSFYKFCHIQDPDSIKLILKPLALKLNLTGTVLLAPEGINASISGQDTSVQDFLDAIQAIPAIGPLELKDNESELSAFRRMLVKVKKEIVTMHKEGLEPATSTGHFLSPEEFKSWMDQGKDLILVDTRNHYEYALGTFHNAIDPKTKSFSEFPEWVEKNLSDKKDATIVTFCTGGIRCEKATAHMKQQGFNNVYQIKGGILNYFAETAQSGTAPHWEGDCVVFDKRKAVKPDLTPTEKELCFICFAALSESDIKREALPAGKLCTPCHHSHEAKQQERQEKGRMHHQEFMKRRIQHCAQMREQWLANLAH